MRPSVEKVLNAANALRSKDFLALNEIVSKNGWVAEFQEYSLSEAINDLQDMLELIIKANDLQLLGRLPLSRLATIEILLNELDYSYNRMVEQENRLSVFIETVDRLRDDHTVFALGIQTKGFPSYEKKRNDLNRLISLSTEASEDWKEFRNNVSQIKEMESNATDSVAEITQIANSAKDLSREIDEKGNYIGIALDTANDASSKVNSIKTELEEFHGVVSDSSVKLKTIEKESKDLISSAKVLIDDSKELLKNATAGTLFSAFNIRADDLSKRMWIWVILIIFFLVVLMALGLKVAEDFKGEPISTSFFFKALLSSPLAYGVLFFTKQFSNDRKLQEEYAFKSTVSLSLPAYREELMKISFQEQGREENIKIMQSAMEQVFRSPQENLSKFPVQESKEPIEVFDKFLDKLPDANK